MTIRNTGMNQKGEPVISFISTTFVERRPERNDATNTRRTPSAKSAARSASPAARMRCTTATPT